MAPKDLKSHAAPDFEKTVCDERKDARELDNLMIACPKCGVAMSKKRPCSEKGPMLDVCPSCQGIWFDEGEFRKSYKQWDARRPKRVQLRFVCPDCDLTIDEQYAVKAHDKIPKCPRCQKDLSFEGVGLILYRDHGLYVIFAVAAMLLAAVIIWNVRYFAEYDRRQINPHQPIGIGDTIYEGTRRVSVWEKKVLPPNLRYWRLYFLHAKERKMINQSYRYILRNLSESHIDIEASYLDSRGEKDVLPITLPVIKGRAVLTIPAGPGVEESKVSQLQIILIGDGQHIQVEYFL